MKLERVEVENLRSFRETQSVDLSGNMCVLVGPNGGGKTNLLDALGVGIRRYVIPSWQSEPVSSARARDGVRFVHNNRWNDAVFSSHADWSDRPTRLSLTLVVTPEDIEGIEATRKLWTDHRAEIERRFEGFADELRLTEKWHQSLPAADSRHSLIIENRSVRFNGSGPTRVYKEYLNLFDRVQQASKVLGSAQPQLPLVSMPANRASAGLIEQVTLSTFSEIEVAQSSDAGFSRSAPQLAQLALGRLAKLHRKLELDKGDVEIGFRQHPRVAKLSDALRPLGYDWRLRLTNADTNAYELVLSKDGRSFVMGEASAGEREILTYFFALHALDVRNALVLVDEPELHLHPRWQKRLVDLFTTMGKATGNQFVLATHSPAFITPETIHQVNRIANRDGASKVIAIRQGTLPEKKHLVRLVNALNVERIFFCDAVILVEGVTDRLVFERLLASLALQEPRFRTIEIVEAQGKTNFQHLSSLLTAFEVPHGVIADLDYLEEIAPERVRHLFEVNTKRLAKSIFGSEDSRDSAALLSALENAVASQDMASLSGMLTYLRNRRRKLRTDLTESDLSDLALAVTAARERGVFVLERGAIESYLPTGTGHADISAVLDLCERGLEISLDAEAHRELEALLSKAIKFSEKAVTGPAPDAAS